MTALGREATTAVDRETTTSLGHRFALDHDCRRLS